MSSWPTNFVKTHLAWMKMLGRVFVNLPSYCQSFYSRNSYFKSQLHRLFFLASFSSLQTESRAI